MTTLIKCGLPLICPTDRWVTFGTGYMGDSFSCFRPAVSLFGGGPFLRPGLISAWRRAQGRSTLAKGHRGTRREAVLTAASTAPCLGLAGASWRCSFCRQAAEPCLAAADDADGRGMEPDQPVAGFRLLQRHGLARERRGDRHQSPFPFYLAGRAHLADRRLGRIARLLQPVWQRPLRGPVECRRRNLAERFMRALLIVILSKSGKAPPPGASFREASDETVRAGRSAAGSRDRCAHGGCRASATTLKAPSAR